MKLFIYSYLLGVFSFPTAFLSFIYAYNTGIISLTNIYFNYFRCTSYDLLFF